MRRVTRILFELFSPAFFGAIQIIAIGVYGSGKLVVAIFLFPFYYLGALFLVGIQSVIYTMIMEFLYRKELPKRSKNALIISTFLGFLIGASLCFSINANGIHVENVYLCIVGSISGFLVSMIIGAQEILEEKIPAYHQDRL